MNNPANLPATISDSASLMAVISKAATDPNVDVSKMERLFALYSEMDNKRAERSFSDAMAEVQSKIPQIFRDRANEHKHYRYTTLEELNKAIVPIYTEHGFGLSFGSAGGAPEGYYRITCHVSHRDGHSRDYEADLPTDMVGDKGAPNKTAIQGFGSTMSYGRRYLTLLIFNVSTTDDDDGEGGKGGEKITPEQESTLSKMMADNGLDVATFLKWAKISTVSDLAAIHYGKAHNILQGKIDAKKTAQKDAAE